MKSQGLENFEIFDLDEMVEEKSRITKNIDVVLGYSVLRYKESSSLDGNSDRLGCNNLNDCIL